MPLMTSTLDRLEAEFAQMPGGQAEVLNAQDEMVHDETHLIILAQRLRLRPVKRFSPLLVIATIGALALALIKGKEASPPPESWSPVDPS